MRNHRVLFIYLSIVVVAIVFFGATTASADTDFTEAPTIESVSNDPIPTANLVSESYDDINAVNCAEIDSDSGCIDERSIFTSDDDHPIALLTIKDLTDSVDVRWEWYTPSGEQYSTHTRTTEQPPDNKYYPEYQAWAWPDELEDMRAGHPGEWSVDIYLDGKEVETLNFFVNGYKFDDSSVCSDVNTNNECIEPQTTFEEGEEVYSHIELQSSEAVDIRWELYNPSGDLFTESTHTTDTPPAGSLVRYDAWYSHRINDDMRYQPGEWTIKGYVENIQYFTDNFVVDPEPVTEINEINIDPSHVDAGEDVQLTAEAVNLGGESDDLVYQWDLNGETHTGPSVVTTLREVGETEIVLEVENEAGETASRTETILVENIPPTVQIQNESFEDVSTEDSVSVVTEVTNPDRSIVDVELRVDGAVVDTDQLSSNQTSEVLTLTYNPSSPGTYDVEVTANDEHGGVDSTARSLEVSSNVLEYDLVAPSSERQEIQSGEQIAFEVSAHDTDSSDISHRWYVNDQFVDTGQTFENEFSTVGSSTVRVVSENDYGATTENEWEINVESPRDDDRTDETAVSDDETGETPANDDETSDDGTNDETPGFGIVTALGAMIAASLLLNRYPVNEYTNLSGS